MKVLLAAPHTQVEAALALAEALQKGVLNGMLLNPHANCFAVLHLLTVPMRCSLAATQSLMCMGELHLFIKSLGEPPALPSNTQFPSSFTQTLTFSSSASSSSTTSRPNRFSSLGLSAAYHVIDKLPDLQSMLSGQFGDGRTDMGWSCWLERAGKLTQLAEGVVGLFETGRQISERRMEEAKEEAIEVSWQMRYRCTCSMLETDSAVRS